MKSLTIIFTVVIILSSCGSKEELKLPEGVLPMEKMVQLLTHIYIIDAATVNHKFPSGITMPADPKTSYEKYLNSDTLSYKDYQKSYDFYLSHPKELNEIYNEVLNELSKLQAIHTKK